MKVYNVKIQGKNESQMMIHLEIHFLKSRSVHTLGWINFLKRGHFLTLPMVSTYMWNMPTKEPSASPPLILSVTSVDQNDLYWAKTGMPSFYSSAVLSVQLFIKYRFKPHKLCTYAKNLWLPSNTSCPERYNTDFKSAVSSYIIPGRIWLIKYVLII